MAAKKELSSKQKTEILEALKVRFEKNMKRHKGMEWSNVKSRLESNASKLWSLRQMEDTSGEPDVVGQDMKSGQYIFMDCSAESPAGRRSLCYDKAALDERKEHKPKGSAVQMAASMGIDLLSEEQYRKLQNLGTFDAKTSSWLHTPVNIRKLGGSIFGDFRYETVFVYHNGAQSYYAARGFRGQLKV